MICEVRLVVLNCGYAVNLHIASNAVDAIEIAVTMPLRTPQNPLCCGCNCDLQFQRMRSQNSE